MSGDVCDTFCLLVPFLCTADSLYPQTSDEIEDWAIGIELSSSFAVSTEVTTLSFKLDGERVNDDADLLFSIL